MFCILILLALGTAHANIIELNPGMSISGAILQSSPGDTILLNEGRYAESVRVLNHSVTIASRYLLDQDTTHISRTVIEAVTEEGDSTSCIIVSFSEDDSLSLIGLTLTGGRGTMWHSPSGDVLSGGGVHSLDSKIRLDHCDIVSCNADYGGGVSMGQPAPDPNTVYTVLKDCRLSNCEAFAYGGGLYSWRSRALIEFTTFEECISDSSAGGIVSIASRMTVSACTLRNCGGIDGAVFMSADNSLIERCVFEGNGNPRSSQFFGACHLTSLENVRIVNNIFRDNTTNDMAINIHDFHQFGVPFFTGNVIESHTMTDRAGAIYTWDCEGIFSFNLFRDCYSERGASIIPSGGGVLRFHHNVFTGNSQDQGGFGSVFNYVNARFNPSQLDSNIFVGNVGPVISYDPSFPGPSYINARNNWWGHESGPYHPTRNPAGLGDTLLLDIVQFEPWLTTPPDTSRLSPATERKFHLNPSTWELLTVYPNPFNSTLRIDLAGFARNDFRIVLFDLLGRETAILHEGSVSGGSLVFRAPESLASGIYFLKAFDNSYVNTTKVVFMK